ncbi:MAG: Uma2 family endonuclease [Saprospiraceae bacterium]|nr:Uma2 family endonuclease [Saprospiraceae bacterium]
MPEELVYETIAGRVFYRKGYREVLNKTKTIEEIIGSSGLQSIIVSYLMKTLFKLDDEKFWILSNEIGLHIDHRNNPASDIGIFDVNVLTPDLVDIHYVSVPAKVFIEVDIRADVDDIGETGYINLKTQELFSFGAEKVIWVLSNIQKVIVAEKGEQTWPWTDWSEDIEVLDGVAFNVGKYLAKKGINPLGK